MIAPTSHLNQRGVFMTYDALTKFLGKPVLVTYMDGRQFRGVFTNTESEFDTASGKDEIELDAGTFCYGIPLDEITDITEPP